MNHVVWEAYEPPQGYGAGFYGALVVVTKLGGDEENDSREYNSPPHPVPPEASTLDPGFHSCQGTNSFTTCFGSSIIKTLLLFL